MVHPDTCVRFISDEIGLGVFATAPIPKGTVVYVCDRLELKLKPDDPRVEDPLYKDHVAKYSYIDQKGVRILSWDHAKYVNHCCDSNTLNTSFGFEIAIKDILPGEEITDDYGLLNIENPMRLYCSKPHCRKTVQAEDLERYTEVWDEKIKNALPLIPTVEQPLLKYLDKATHHSLQAYLSSKKNYESVAVLKYTPVLVPLIS